MKKTTKFKDEYDGADEIAVVMDGRITERGTHDELIAADGTYKQLYALQFRDNDTFGIE